MSIPSNPHSTHHTARAFPSAVLVLGCMAAIGCNSHHRGVGTADRQGNLVDNSWVSAARSCWPYLTRDGYDTDRIKRNLAVPANFRNAFPTYAALTNPGIAALLVKPVEAAPPPDITRLAHSANPILTAGQAAAGTSPGNAVVAATNGAAPPDALCAVQDEIPAGFR